MMYSGAQSNRLAVIRDFLYITDQLCRPGLSALLDLHPQNVLFGTLAENLRYDDKKRQLSVRYQIPPKACSNNIGGKLPLSGFLSLFDEISTWNLLCEDKWRRPGVSTHLQAELGPAGLKGNGVKPGDVIDIRTRVIKLGKVLGVAHAEAIDVDSGEVICIARHTKYMPTSLLLKMLLGPLMPLTKIIASLATKENTAEIGKEAWLDKLFQFQDIAANKQCGRINVVDYHNNPMGVCHGGSQAVMMEMLGHKAATDGLVATSAPLLRSISVTYLSPGRGALDLGVVPVVSDKYSTSLCVKIQSERGSLVSEGILTFITGQARL
mmetsp:Transcript_21448/g.31871  ORF Transcript_21448/g.31871 Transcript_21448/m.31871 type:complete len:323 (-) Transcript_21448:295-1263(-)